MQVHFHCRVPLESLPYLGRLFRGCTVWNHALRSSSVVHNQRSIDRDRRTNREEAWREYVFERTF
jgi:hypothetical protein